MTDVDLKSIANALTVSLTQRIDLSDSEDMGRLIDPPLHAQVLHDYREQLEGLQGAEAFAWLLYRMAEIESRVLALQAVSRQAQATAPQSATILFDDALVQTGFYPAERAPGGLVFRWLGPTPRASVFLPKLRPPLRLTLRLFSAFVPEALGTLRVALDGGDWAGVTVAPDKHGYVLTAMPRAGTAARSATMRLDIDAVRTRSPQEKGGKDTRELAIAISSIEIVSL